MKGIHLLGVLVLIGIALGAGVALKQSTGAATGGLPGYARASPAIQEAYRLAVDNPEVLDGVPCFCGCMQHLHNGRIHSRGLLDCYRNGNTFDIHASQCDMCIRDALEAKQMAQQGISKSVIIDTITAKYAGQGGQHV